MQNRTVMMNPNAMMPLLIWFVRNLMDGGTKSIGYREDLHQNRQNHTRRDYLGGILNFCSHCKEGEQVFQERRRLHVQPLTLSSGMETNQEAKTYCVEHRQTLPEGKHPKEVQCSTTHLHYHSH